MDGSGAWFGLVERPASHPRTRIKTGQSTDDAIGHLPITNIETYDNFRILQNEVAVGVAAL